MIVCSTKYFEVEGGGIGPVLSLTDSPLARERLFRSCIVLCSDPQSRYNVTGCAIFSTRERFCLHHWRIRSHTLFLLRREKTMMSSCALAHTHHIFLTPFLCNSCNFQYLIWVRPLWFSALQLSLLLNNMQHHTLNRDMVTITIQSADRWTVLISQRLHVVPKVKRRDGLTEKVIMKKVYHRHIISGI